MVKKSQNNAERDGKQNKGAIQSTVLRGQTSRIVRPQTDPHRRCRVRPTSQTRYLPTCLRRTPVPQSATHPGHVLHPITVKQRKRNECRT